MSIKSIITVLGILVIGFFGYVAYKDAVSIWQNLHKQQEQIQNLNDEYKKLDVKLDETIETKEQSQQEVQKLEEEKRKLEEERQRLERELQAKAESKARLAAASERVINTATNTQTASATPARVASGGCGDNQYAAYIYGQESGGRVTGNCDPAAVNEGGCRGIGQACPGSKLPCGADYACQNAWFTQYAMSTYGSWAAAFNFHKANGWW